MNTQSVTIERSILKHGQRLLLLAGLLAALLAHDAIASTPKIDFNQDGCSDIAIGAPDANVNGIIDAGTVTVIYGTSDCRVPQPAPQLWHEGLASIPGEPAAYDHFGYALATGDFNADGYTDLAIGVPSKSIVIILHGSPRGLRGAENPCLFPCVYQPKILKMAQPQTGDQFGFSLAVGHFNLDQYADLAVGAPEYDSPEHSRSGAVGVFYGSSTSLPVLSNLRLRARTLLQREAYVGQFGYALAAGNFNGDGAADLAISVPNWDPESNGFVEAAVAIIYGGGNGLIPELRQDVPGHYQWWTGLQLVGEYIGSPGYFGWSLAAGDFGKNHQPFAKDQLGRYDDLAIGRPIEPPGKCGSVVVLYGGSNGLSEVDRQILRLNPSGHGGCNDSWPPDSFGYALAAGNFGYSPWDDLAIGVPGHVVQGQDHAGIVLVLFGTNNGLDPDQDLVVKMDVVQAETYFGEVLSSARLGGDSRADLAIGVRLLSETLKEVGGVFVRYGSNTGPDPSTSDVLWTMYRLGLCCSEAYAHFGAAVSK